MHIYKEQRGIMTTFGLLIISLFVSGGTGYLIYRAKYRHSDMPPVASQQQNTTSPQTSTGSVSPQMTIDYPLPQGIKGQVFCNDKVDPVPCQTKLELQIQPSNPSMGSDGPIKTIETDVEGKFGYDTAPGTYIITPAPKVGYPMFVPPLPNPVIVKDRQVTEITITYHSGLR